MTTPVKKLMDKTWPEAFRAPLPPKKIRVVPIKMLQEKLQELREHFQNTRPLLPKETRQFTYQKEKKEIKMDEKGKPVLKMDKKGKPVLLKSGKTVPIYQPMLDVNGKDHLYEWVTEPSVVRLRKFGIPQAEKICQDLARQMRELKQLIMEQGCEPIDYGETFAQWDIKRKLEEAADARAKEEAEAQAAVKAEADAKEAKAKAKVDKKRGKDIAAAALKLKNKEPIAKKIVLDEFDEEFSKL